MPASRTCFSRACVDLPLGLIGGPTPPGWSQRLSLSRSLWCFPQADDSRGGDFTFAERGDHVLLSRGSQTVPSGCRKGGATEGANRGWWWKDPEKHRTRICGLRDKESTRSPGAGGLQVEGEGD